MEISDCMRACAERKWPAGADTHQYAQGDPSEKTVFLTGSFAKRLRAAHMFNHGWWQLLVGGWWRLAVGGW